jgi:hypothetical protein
MRVAALKGGKHIGKGLGGLLDGLWGGFGGVFDDGQGLWKVVVGHDVYSTIVP